MIHLVTPCLMSSILGSATALSIIPDLVLVGLIIGFCSGLLIMPVQLVCLRDKDPMKSVSIVYGSASLVCFSLLVLGNPLWTLIGTMGTVFLMCILSALILPNRFPRSHEDACPECGYCLRGNISGVCPECGTPIAEETKQRLEAAESVTGPVG